MIAPYNNPNGLIQLLRPYWNGKVTIEVFIRDGRVPCLEIIIPEIHEEWHYPNEMPNYNLLTARFTIRINRREVRVTQAASAVDRGKGTTHLIFRLSHNPIMTTRFDCDLFFNIRDLYPTYREKYTLTLPRFRELRKPTIPSYDV